MQALLCLLVEWTAAIFGHGLRSFICIFLVSPKVFMMSKMDLGLVSMIQHPEARAIDQDFKRESWNEYNYGSNDAAESFHD